MLDAQLQIDFHGYWHAGTGNSAGTETDALTQRDPNGLPIISGRHLKGLLRHAVRRAEAWGWLQDYQLPEGPADSLETLLFGSTSQINTRYNTLPGMLIITDGKLSNAEANWLAHPDQAIYRQAMTTLLHSTAINDEGGALAQSLRSMETVIPLSLHAQLQLQISSLAADHRAQQQAWLDAASPWTPLQEALPLIDALGAKRSRGLGEASLTLQPLTATRS